MWRLTIKVACAIVVFAALSFAQTGRLTEAEGLKAVERATNPTAKLAAAEEFVKRFPQSKHRREIATLVAWEILVEQDGTVAVTLFERAQSIFTTEEEREIFKPLALGVYAAGDRPDEAFRLAAEKLSKDTDDVQVLVLMAEVGAKQLIKKNPKYADLALQYGLKAIDILESGKKPENMDQLIWGGYTGQVGQVYQHVAVLYLGRGEMEKPKTLLRKAIASSPYHPPYHAFLARVLKIEYEKEKAANDLLPEGQQKHETQKRLNQTLDTIIDEYAQAVGMSTGRPEYQAAMQQMIPDLTRYYKERNNQSTQGLQQLIDKYKPGK